MEDVIHYFEGKRGGVVKSIRCIWYNIFFIYLIFILVVNFRYDDSAHKENKDLRIYAQEMISDLSVRLESCEDHKHNPKDGKIWHFKNGRYQ